MGYVRKTTRKEHETPKHSRFQCLVKQGIPQAEAARRVQVNRKTAIKWLHKRPSDQRTGKTRPGRPPIISDAQVEEMIK
jgi:transposase